LGTARFKIGPVDFLGRLRLHEHRNLSRAGTHLSLDYRGAVPKLYAVGEWVDLAVLSSDEQALGLVREFHVDLGQGTVENVPKLGAG
jgi:hypothetical protein